MDESTPKPLYLHAFADQARRFCQWATGADGSTMSAAAASAQLANLYLRALPFGQLTPDDLAPFERQPDASTDVVRRVLARIYPSLPHQFEWFNDRINPAGNQREHYAVLIANVYVEIARGLAMWDQGLRAQAQADWALNFKDWGADAAVVLSALHPLVSVVDFERVEAWEAYAGVTET